MAKLDLGRPPKQSLALTVTITKDTQEKNSCSLVLKLKVFRSLYFQVLTGALHHGVSRE